MKTMKTKLLFAAALALALTACSDNNNDHSAPDDGQPVAARFAAEIDGEPTRASGTTWTAGDRIGISTVGDTKTVYANIPYKYEAGAFVPDGTTIYFQSPQPVTFNAYYPFRGESGIPTESVEAVTQMQGAAVQPQIDFLFAEGATASKDAPTVTFTGKQAFKHCMSQLTLTFIEGKDISLTGLLSSYTLEGLIHVGTFYTATGTALADTEIPAIPLTIDLTDVTAQAGRYTAASVILFPQQVQDGAIGLEVTVDGEPYKARLTLPAGATALAAGNNYKFPVTVSKTGLSVGAAEIADWNPVEGNPADATM